MAIIKGKIFQNICRVSQVNIQKSVLYLLLIFILSSCSSTTLLDNNINEEDITTVYILEWGTKLDSVDGKEIRWKTDKQILSLPAGEHTFSVSYKTNFITDYKRLDNKEGGYYITQYSHKNIDISTSIKENLLRGQSYIIEPIRDSNDNVYLTLSTYSPTINFIKDALGWIAIAGGFVMLYIIIMNL